MAPITKKALGHGDENATTTRVTRAKAAALGASDMTADVKKPLQQRVKATANTRKRAALDDVSNVAKTVANAGKGKTGLVSKSAQPTGVLKAKATKSTLVTKKTDLKRSASGTVGNAPAAKKRNTSSSTGQKSDAENDADVDTDAPVVKGNELVKITKVEDQQLVLASQDDVKKEDLCQVIVHGASGMPPGVEDLDAEDEHDPLMVSEYVVEIFHYLEELEEKCMPNPDYMDSQKDLEWKMRGILIDWLLEVHTRFRLLPETLFLTVNIIDRFLSTKVVQLDRLQLVGITAMFIASKYEEVLSPHVQNFRHVADDGFTEAEILSAERFILAALNYDLSYANPMNFLRRISKADNYDVQTRTLGKYLLEIALVDHRLIQYKPSHVAAASMYLARAALDRDPWDATLTHYSGYSEDEIIPVFLLMIDYLYGPVQHDALFKKYASKKFLKASMVVRSWVKSTGYKYLTALTKDHALHRLPAKETY
ncbi:A/B/D/E cyclin [Trichodelitschia bisporula]|uniref:A/B/D/E cyclin n=1 Tax=Trichodelitschia bisporula TaxID=703511 RepID=A0A6G1HZZ8_9PEZI|nr:A/B/D/E cyclin [Trichodelitschia bisporula]